MNVLNQNHFEHDVEEFVKPLNMDTRLVSWAIRSTIRHLRSLAAPLDADWHVVCSQARMLGIDLFFIVTEREYALQNRTSALQLRTLRHYGEFQTQSWAQQAVANGQVLVAMKLCSGGVLHNLMETVQEHEGLAVRDYSVTMKVAYGWMEQRQQRLEREASLIEGEVECVFQPADSEYSMWWLKDRQAYGREGLVMHHCVGRYEVKDNTRIWSVRDAEGKSLATLESNVGTGFFDHSGEKIRQIRGANNLPVADEVDQFINRWIETTDIKPLAVMKTAIITDLPHTFELHNGGVVASTLLHRGASGAGITREEVEEMLEERFQVIHTQPPSQPQPENA